MLAVTKPCAVKFLLKSLVGSRRQIGLQYKLGQPRARVPSPAVQLFQVLQRFRFITPSSPPIHFRHFHDDPGRLCLALPGLHSSKDTQRKKLIRPSRERRTKLFLTWLLPYLLQVYNLTTQEMKYTKHIKLKVEESDLRIWKIFHFDKRHRGSRWEYLRLPSSWSLVKIETLKRSGV